MAVLNVLFSKVIKFAHGSPNQDAVRAPSREENLSRALGKVEPYVVWLQSILIWEKPTHTLFAYLGFNVLFWSIVSLNLRFYFLLCSTTLVVLIYEMWVDKVWPEIRVPQPAEHGDSEGWTPLHPNVLSAPELSHYLNKAMQFAHNQFNWLQGLRNNQPGLFFALMSIGCMVLMWIGRSVSGTTLLYIIFMSLLFIPGLCIHVLPSASQVDWQSHLQNIGSKDDSDVEEYLPEPSSSNMVFLEKAVESDHSDHDEEEDFNIPHSDLLHVDDMTDSGAPSLTFVSGISAMPPHEDISLDCSDFSFEIPQTVGNQTSPSACPTGVKKTVSSLDVDLNNSDSDESIPPVESESEGIHFQNLHFKRDSSSEDDSTLIKTSQKDRDTFQSTGKGHRKSSSAPVSVAAAGALSLASQCASVGQSLISSVIGSSFPSAQGSQPVPVKEEVDDDDSLSDSGSFEMISEEECANS